MFCWIEGGACDVLSYETGIFFYEVAFDREEGTGKNRVVQACILTNCFFESFGYCCVARVEREKFGAWIRRREGDLSAAFAIFIIETRCGFVHVFQDNR